MPDPLPDFDLDRYLPYRLSAVAARVSEDLARHYKSQFGLSTPEWRVLLNLGYSGDVSVRDIEKRVALEKSKVSRAASRLETKGLITKLTDPADRRLLKMALTPKGIEVLHKLVPVAKAYQDKLGDVLGAQADALQNALDRLMRDP